MPPGIGFVIDPPQQLLEQMRQQGGGDIEDFLDDEMGEEGLFLQTLECLKRLLTQ